jgi:hypothetical protein
VSPQSHVMRCRRAGRGSPCRWITLLAALFALPHHVRADDFAAHARAEAATRLPAYPAPLEASYPSSDAAAAAITRRLVLLETRERGLRAIGRPTKHKIRQIGGWVGFGVCLVAAGALPLGARAVSRADPDLSTDDRRLERTGYALSGIFSVGAGFSLWAALSTPSNPFKEEIVKLYLERRALRHRLNDLPRPAVAVSLRGTAVHLSF